jgi:hypothetical protein
MIRNYWSVTDKRTLKEEIDAIKEKVEPDTWDAIDAVRTVGNIGAHMEQDINLVIDVEPEEAALLIWLVERLIEDWYIARDHRQRTLAQIKALKEEKASARTVRTADSSDDLDGGA